MTALQPSAHRSHCPYKGDASYFSIVVDGKKAENAVWGTISRFRPWPKSPGT